MAQAQSSKVSQPPLVDKLLQYGQMAFNPELPKETRQLNQPKFSTLIESTGTLALMPALNLLVQPGRTQPWLRAPIISALAKLPLREHGVQHAIEFVLSVHPSSAGYNISANVGKGAGISHEALNAASRLLSSPPGGMTAEKWFSGIAPQLFALLDGEGEPEMDRAAAFIIGFGILGRKQYGAPGMPGWEAFVEPILSCIDPAIGPPSHLLGKRNIHSEIISLSPNDVVVSSSDVAKGLRRLTTLLTTHPHPSLSKRLLAPIVLPLWCLSSWPQKEEFIQCKFSEPATKLLKTFLQLSASGGHPREQPSLHDASRNLSMIVENLIFRGNSHPPKLQWIYTTSSNSGIEIWKRPEKEVPGSPFSGMSLAAIDDAATSFVNLVEPLSDLDSEVSQLFMKLCKRWLIDGEATSAPLILTRPNPTTKEGDIETQLIQAKVMQKMMMLIPGKLIDNSRQVLDLVNQVLSNCDRGNHNSGEDTSSIALSLLNLVLTSPKFQESRDIKLVLESIKVSLGRIGKKDFEISSTARNLLLLLKFRNTIGEAANSSSDPVKDQQSEDRKSYNLALSYLTATDSPPPVRAQGLELLSALIRANSSILDIPALLVLFSSLLQDPDEYIYLRVIKSFVEISGKHPKATMKDLVDRYVDPNEDSELDQRLRFGEALLQVIQNSHLSFSVDTARSVCEGLLSIAGRRGQRPKSQKEQEKRNRLKREKDEEAKDAWGGEVPQFEDELTPENEIIAHIVAGWESKRGTEDIRIRASALSILGSAIEMNVSGIGSNLVSTSVDLSIHILTLEPEPEKGILRRAAILLIMSFERALDAARQKGTKIGFGLVGQSLDDIQRVLKYVEDSDNDGLVRQYARDVIEGLQTWQINSLLPSRSEQMEITDLAGLSINPASSEDSNSRARPRIEEIE